MFPFDESDFSGRSSREENIKINDQWLAALRNLRLNVWLWISFSTIKCNWSACVSWTVHGGMAKPLSLNPCFSTIWYANAHGQVIDWNVVDGRKFKTIYRITLAGRGEVTFNWIPYCNPLHYSARLFRLWTLHRRLHTTQTTDKSQLNGNINIYAKLSS